MEIDRRQFLQSLFCSLFVMTVDPKINSTPSADIEKYSFFSTEVEVLLSMHSIFRIGKIRTLGTMQRPLEVQLGQVNKAEERYMTLIE